MNESSFLSRHHTAYDNERTQSHTIKRPLPSLASIDSTRRVHHPYSEPMAIPSIRTSTSHQQYNPPMSFLRQSPQYFQESKFLMPRHNQLPSLSSSLTKSEPIALPKLRSMSMGDFVPRRPNNNMYSSGPHGMQQHYHDNQVYMDDEPEVVHFNAPMKLHSQSFDRDIGSFMPPYQRFPQHSQSWTPASSMTSNFSNRSSPVSESKYSISQMVSNSLNISSSDDEKSVRSESTNMDENEQSSKRVAGTRICRTKSCKNVARSKGLCRSHGGGKRCTEPGCSKSAQANKKCIAHGGGTPCSYENCDKTAQSRGLCKAHGGGARCKFPSCPKSSQSKGYCRGHGGGVRCKSEGCEKWVQKNGFCIKHGREQSM